MYPLDDDDGPIAYAHDVDEVVVTTRLTSKNAHLCMDGFADEAGWLHCWCPPVTQVEFM